MDSLNLLAAQTFFILLTAKVRFFLQNDNLAEVLFGS
jgi:hypothetical protein